MGPGRICNQQPADGHDVELIPVEALDEVVDRGEIRRGVATGELFVEADRADGDRWFAAQLLCPSGEVQVGVRERRLPVAARRTVVDVDPSGSEWREPSIQRI